MSGPWACLVGFAGTFPGGSARYLKLAGGSLGCTGGFPGGLWGSLGGPCGLPEGSCGVSGDHGGCLEVPGHPWGALGRIGGVLGVAVSTTDRFRMYTTEIEYFCDLRAAMTLIGRHRSGMGLAVLAPY